MVVPGFFGCATAPEVSKNQASLLYDQGLRYFNKGNYEKAREIFHDYISDHSDTHLYPISLYYLGYCYQKLGESKQALLIYHKVIDESDDDFWDKMAQTRIREVQEMAP